MSLPRPMSVVSPIQIQPSVRSNRRLNPEYRPVLSAFPQPSRSANANERRRTDNPPVERLQTMARPPQAYTVARTNINHRRERTAASSPKPKLSKLSISGPVSPPFYPSVPLHVDTNREGNPTRYANRTTSWKKFDQLITLQITWHSALRCVLRITSIALSAAVVGLLAHTLGVYRNRSVDISKGEFPTPWPSQTGATATYLLFSIAFINVLSSVTILVCSVKRQFSTPMGARDKFRVAAGVYMVISWVVACAASKVVDTDSSVSLEHFACKNVNTLGPGRGDYRTVCREQNTSFYIAVISGILEILVLATYIFSAFAKPMLLLVRDPEKGQLAHIFK